MFPAGTSAAPPDPSPVVGAAFALLDLREAMAPPRYVRLLEKAYTKPERDQGAKEGWAMSDGSYPIKTKADIENAVNDWGRTGSDPAVKTHIIAQAKKIEGGTEALPADWTGSTKQLRESIAKAVKYQAFRESAFPLIASYDLAGMMRNAGVLWADAQATGNSEDEADAASLAKTVKRVIERHPEIVQLSEPCGCGPVCNC